MKSKAAVALACVVTLVGATPAIAAAPMPPAVLEPITRDLGGSVGAVAVGDVVGDAKNDVIVTVGSDPPDTGGAILVFQRLANGTLATSPSEIPLTGFPGLEMTVGDLDDDGDDDVVVTGQDDIEVFLQGASGLPSTPSATYPVPTGRWAESLVVADLNDDGRDDLVYVLRSDDGNEQVVRRSQLAGGALGTAVSLLTTPLREFQAGDVNNDGLEDLVFGNSAGLPVLLQQPDHSFTTGTVGDVGENYGDVLVEDVTDDGLTDVVTFVWPPSQEFRILEGATGAMPTLGDHFSTFSQNSFVAGDLNGDGTTDVVSDGGTPTLQADDGSFAPSCEYQTRGVPHAITDLTGDGRPELLTGQGTSIFLYPLEPAASQMTTTTRLWVTPSAQAGNQVSIEGGVSYPLGGCIDTDAAVEIIRKVPGGSPEVVNTITLPTRGVTETSFVTTDTLPLADGTVLYWARFVGDALHAPSQSDPQSVTVTKRDPRLELDAPRQRIKYGETVTLIASMLGPSEGTVVFSAEEGASQVEIGSDDIDASGQAELVVKPTEITTYTASFAGDQGYNPVDSKRLHVRVVGAVEGALKRFSSREGKYAIYRPSARVFYTAKVRPIRPHDQVNIRLEFFDQGWHSAGSYRFPLDADGSVTIYVRAHGLPIGMPFRFVTTWRGDRRVGEGHSQPDYFKVRR